MTKLEKLAMDASKPMWGGLVKSYFADGYRAGFRECRELVLSELSSIAGQTEDPKILSLIGHFKSLGDDDDQS